MRLKRKKKSQRQCFSRFYVKHKITISKCLISFISFYFFLLLIWLLCVPGSWLNTFAPRLRSSITYINVLGVINSFDFNGGSFVWYFFFSSFCSSECCFYVVVFFLIGQQPPKTSKIRCSCVYQLPKNTEKKQKLKPYIKFEWHIHVENNKFLWYRIVGDTIDKSTTTNVCNQMRMNVFGKVFIAKYLCCRFCFNLFN